MAIGGQSMPRYWVIAPVESNPPEQFDKVWQWDLANKFISIGWSQIGKDVSKMRRDELSNAVESTYPDKPPATHALIANMIWAFYHEIAPGDFVLARRGLMKLAAVGKVTQAAIYSPGMCRLSSGSVASSDTFDVNFSPGISRKTAGSNLGEKRSLKCPSETVLRPGPITLQFKELEGSHRILDFQGGVREVLQLHLTHVRDRSVAPDHFFGP
jgi:hypothetical protein